MILCRLSSQHLRQRMRRAQEAGAKIIFATGNQTWGDEPAAARPDAYAGAFADPDGHLWQFSRVDGVLIQ